MINTLLKYKQSPPLTISGVLVFVDEADSYQPYDWTNFRAVVARAVCCTRFRAACPSSRRILSCIFVCLLTRFTFIRLTNQDGIQKAAE